MNKLTHKVLENGNVKFEFAPINITISEVEGDDICESGGVRFTMNFMNEDVAKKVDEFVIYPEAIDWEKGGQMKAEYQEKIKAKMEKQQQFVDNEIEATKAHKAKLEDSPTDADEAMSVSKEDEEVHSK